MLEDSRVVVGVIDLNGRLGYQTYASGVFNNFGLAGAIATDLQNVMSGHLAYDQIIYDWTTPSIVTGSSGPYATIQDIAVLIFKCDDGTAANFTILTPLNIFLADHETVDPTLGTVATLITDLLIYGAAANGSEYNAYIRGYRAKIDNT